MACAVLQPAHHHDAMKVHGAFKGDNELLVDRLIAASARKEVPAEALVERALVPFFDTSDASTDSFQALQPSGRRAASKPVAVPKHQQPAGLKRHAHDRSSSQLSGSPPRKESEVLQAKHAKRGGKPAASAASGAPRRAASPGSDTEMSSPPQLASAQRKPRSGGKKHAREAAPAAKPAGGSQRQSPPRKRPEPALDMRQLAASAAAAGALLRTPGGSKPAARAPLPTKFAGPAFTNSPMPDCLPIPTSSLLLAEAAEGLRSRLTL